MALITYKPTSAGRRHLVTVDRGELHKGRAEPSLVETLHRTGGRNNNGRITTRHIGGGHKRKYRKIDFRRNKMDVTATVERLEYDPNRTAFIALVKYDDGELAYILAPQKLKAGDKVVASTKADILPGNALPLKNIPVGTIVHNVEMKPGKGGQLARSAGTSVQLVGKDGAYVQVRLRSGELRLVHETCMATVGVVSNPDHSNQVGGKAGRTRWKGVRPTVRGSCMNPVDHPHGGGEGKSNSSRHPVSPWGKPTEGAKTRKPQISDKYIITSRHRAKKKR